MPKRLRGDEMNLLQIDQMEQMQNNRTKAENRRRNAAHKKAKKDRTKNHQVRPKLQALIDTVPDYSVLVDMVEFLADLVQIEREILGEDDAIRSEDRNPDLKIIRVLKDEFEYQISRLET